MGFLVALKLLLLVIVLGTTIYSGIVYSARRRGSARELSSLRDQAQPLRRLSANERDALAPFLVQPNRPGKPVHLTSEEVFPLRGEYQRHGIQSNGHQSWHHMIGGVEVILPFDAELFLDQDNEAEVVFADKLAVVVRLNGFELLEGAARDARRDAAEDQWQQGVRGTLEQVYVDDEAPRAEDEAEAARRRVEIHDQRPETAAETEARLGRGLGLLPGLLWALAFLALGIAVFRDTLVWLSVWGGLALVLAFSALWLFWRRRTPGPAGKVNRVTGTVNLVPLSVDEASGTVSVIATLGGKLTFETPEHWRPHTPLEDGQRLELEMRVEDHSVVTYDRKLSVDEEYRRCPPVYPGRHLSLAVVAVVALLVGLGALPDPAGDLAQTVYWLGSAGTLHADDPASLAANPPQAGRRVVLDGRGRCQVTPVGSDWSRADIRCDRLRWGGDELKRPDLELDDATLALTSDDALQTHSDPRLRMLALLRGGGTGDREPLLLTNAKDLVARVDRVCQVDEPPHACGNARQTILSALNFPELGQLENWDDLRQQLQERGEDASPAAVTLKGHLGSIRRQLRSLADQHARDKVARLAEAIAAQQRGGVLVEVTAGMAAGPLQGGADTLERWRALQTLFGEDGMRAFHVEGMVAHQGSDQHGTPGLIVDPERGERPWQALLRSIWIVMAATLLLVHGALWLRNWMAARQRRRAVARLHGWPAA
ncbi:IgaA/UmoB family intracellular growth attenuator [Alloalcanivorax marinus]|uniref:IgaA/UmoB family intracellular growth attenuator n=1 Tax=Alloalcanivorax marinus TaxID=1177169 RepID=UPI0019319D2C|nr:IgaA/UmoB family intracellular growth attenuator [Alloalcanivorax marinus]MBL7252456.1 intracellular growth attenuator family protein [Alloalcanivorax marinus]